MKVRVAALLLLILPAFLLGLALAPPLSSGPLPGSATDLLNFSSDLADLAERVKSATVFLKVTPHESGDSYLNGPGERSGRMRQTGSGFVIDATRGLVVTNAHVVGGKDSRVNVTLNDGRERPADVVGLDDATDLAVVKIPPGFARRELSWGDSDELRPGSLLLAVGSPLMHQGTTSWGVLSGTSREVPGLPQHYQDYLQSDLFIDRGSSGGPLVDMSGQVVGVNTAIAGRDGWSGISYSVPSNLASYVAQELVENGRVRRGWLGVELRDVTSGDALNSGLARPYGARAHKVNDGPAKDAGMRRGDIILSVNGVEVASYRNLQVRIGSIPPGSVAVLRVWRNEAPMTMRVVLGENPDVR